MSEKNPVVLMQTSMGEITLELNSEKAPITVENFLGYVKDGFFDGTIFHRVIANFMVQGGGMTADMKEKKNKSPIKNEADNGLDNVRGSLAMARTQVVDSATSQFFINMVDNDFLNHTAKTSAGYGYAVFAKVTEGMNVVDEIGKVKTGNKGHHQDVPVDAVVIEKVSLISE
jgi:peptidyl-prolyl cis-trans isomerase B (cyclophilin B)